MSIRELIDPKVTVGNLISIFALLVPLGIGGMTIYFQVQAMAGEIQTIRTDARQVRTDLNSQDGRVIRLETRLDIIIEQQALILQELRR